MTKEEARILFMDHLYGELDEATSKELLQFIETDEELKREFEELTDAKSVLHHLPVQSPVEQLVIMEPKTATTDSFWSKLSNALIPRNTMARTGLAMASLLLLFVVTGAVTDLNVSAGNGEFSITFGEQPPVQTGYTAAQVDMIINQVQQENAAMIGEFILASQEQQEIQFQETLSTFANYLYNQRESDLEFLTYGISNLQQATDNRFRQTDQVLGEIIQTVSTN
ncbi:MAG: hypothetical protein ED557_09390 [Balneola sp.]|nr:MAG: hypothetical protein ED557_09390 [Balneola sp.]